MFVSLKNKIQGDPVIWVIIIVLLIFSILSVYSAIVTLAHRPTQIDASGGILKHVGLLFSAVVLMVATMQVPYRKISMLAPILFWGTLLLLIFTTLFGVIENDAVRRLSMFGLTFQPSEVAKITLIAFLARELALKQNRLNDFKNVVLPLFLKMLVLCALIFTSNFSTAFILFSASISLMFIGMVPFKYLSVLVTGTALLCLMFVSGAFVLEKSGVHTRITTRTVTWVNRIASFGSFTVWPEQEVSEVESERQLADDYQAEQARIAVGTGGIFGKGPGKSTQRNFLPQPYSDFIYALIIEEYGVLGGGLILFLYLTLFYRTTVLVWRSDRIFPSYLAIGLTLMILYQAMIHMGVSIGVFPITGQPLPMVSKGGSSVLITGISLGILLRISRDFARKKQVVAEETAIDQEREEVKDSFTNEEALWT